MEKAEQVDNFDEDVLNGLFAELDQQNAILAAEAEAEKKAVAAIKTEPTSDEIADEIGDMLDEQDLLDAVEAVTKTVVEPVAKAEEPKTEAQAALDAEQEFDLDEVFEAVKEHTAQEIVADEISADDLMREIEAEHVETPPVESFKTLEPEPMPDIETETDEEVELQDKTIPDFAPKEASKSAKTEVEMARVIELKYAPDIAAFNKDIAFTEATLDLAMRMQASLAAYQNERAARATAQAARIKLKFESVEALLYEAYRKHFVSTGEKVTEKAVENAVRKDSRWVKAKEALIEAEMYADIHKGFVYALRDRNDMLIQAGAAARQERGGQLRMNEAQSQAQTLDNQRSAASEAMKKAYKS